MSTINRITIAVFIALSSLLVAQAQQEAPALPTLTLEQSIAVALKNGRTLKQAQQVVDKAGGRVLEAKSAGGLQVGLSASYTRRDSAFEQLPLAVGFDPSTQQLVFQHVNMVLVDTGTTGLTLTKVLDINGIIRAGTKAASLGKNLAELDVTRARNELVMQVKQSYYDALRAKDLMAVADVAVKNAQTRLIIAQARVKSGVTAKLDVFRAETSVATAQQNQLAARNAYQLSKAALNNVIGQRVDTEFDVQANDAPDQADVAFPELLKEALEKRPEVAMTKTLLAQTQQQSIVALRGSKPSLAVTGGSSYDYLNQGDKGLVSYVGVSVQVPISDSGLTRGRVAEAKADIESAKITRTTVEDAVALEVRQASLTVQNVREQVATAEKAQQQAVESLRVSRARYEAGVGDQLELSDAELALTQAQQNVVNAHNDLRVSQARLEKALGRFAQ